MKPKTGKKKKSYPSADPDQIAILPFHILRFTYRNIEKEHIIFQHYHALLREKDAPTCEIFLAWPLLGM